MKTIPLLSALPRNLLAPGTALLLFACEVELTQGVPTSSLSTFPQEFVLEPRLDELQREAQPVTWLRFPGSAALVGSVRLFEGSLSSYDQGRIARDDLPSTLLEREIPLVTWTEAEDLVAAPTRLLSNDTAYAAAWSDGNLVAEFHVGLLQPGVVLSRLWPPSTHSAGVFNLFCGSDVVAVEPEELPLGGVDSHAEVQSAANWGLPHCVWLEVTELPGANTPVVLPQRLGEWLLPPDVVTVGQGLNVAPECPEGDVGVPGACLYVEDDRVVLSAVSDGLWIVEGDAIKAVQALVANNSLVVKGLRASTRQTLGFQVYDLAGIHRSFDLDLTTAVAAPRVVISEVMANPSGPEPTQEWVELVNDGTTAVDLGGWTISDAGTETLLPSYEIQPGEYVLLVSRGWEADPDLGAVPPEGVAILELDQLGKGGLSNSGELLRLRAPDGTTVSKFPETPKPENGVSVARRFPHTLFRQSTDIGKHAAPFSSPGLPNALE